MESKKTINVTLYVKEIIYDVMNKTHLTGVSRMAEGSSNYEAGAHMQASEDAEHSYQIRRSISNAFSLLKVELGEYLQQDCSVSNNRIIRAVDDDGVLTMQFQLPSNFNNSACDSLGGALHEYIVDRAIYDWFAITNKADAAEYMALAQVALETAKKALYKRERPTRPIYIDDAPQDSVADEQPGEPVEEEGRNPGDEELPGEDEQQEDDSRLPANDNQVPDSGLKDKLDNDNPITEGGPSRPIGQ